MRVIVATVYRVLYALCGFAVATAGALIEGGIVDWDKRLVAYTAIGVGAVAFFDNSRLIRYKWTSRERHAARSRMYKPVVTALSSISDARPVTLMDLGISVFGIHRKWVLRNKFVPWYERRLHRVLRFRLSDDPPESDICWTANKGAIGECWAKGIRILDDLRDTTANFGDPRKATEASFLQLPQADRRGFTYKEFLQCVGKYGEVLATPIRAKHSGQLVGVVSIDCVSSAYESVGATESILAGEDIEVFAQRAANLIRDDVEKF